MVYRPTLPRIPELLRPGYPVDRVEFRSCPSRLLSCFTDSIFAAAFGSVSTFDAFQIPYKSSLRIITADEPVTAGAWFQGVVSQVDIQRVVAVSTQAHWLTYGLEFVLTGSHSAQN